MKGGILLLIVFVVAGCRSDVVEEEPPAEPVVTEPVKEPIVRTSAPVEFAKGGLQIWADERMEDSFRGNVSVKVEPAWFEIGKAKDEVSFLSAESLMLQEDGFRVEGDVRYREGGNYIEGRELTMLRNGELPEVRGDVRLSIQKN